MRHLTFFCALIAAAVLSLPAAACANVIHMVRRGETLTSIAAADGLSVARLAAANGLSIDSELDAGAEIQIPPQSGPVSAAASAPASASSSGGYLVRRGDTLSGIAARFGTSAAALAAANGMSVDGVLLAGRTLTVPGGSSEAASIPSATGAQPVAAFVSPGDVGAIAEADGVPPALAEAIADQESGFNDDEVSATGAIGVMQIEPATWDDLTREGLQLSPDSPLDNVRGGVALLRSLLLATGENQALTIAAYYQGLQSVRTRGLYPDTRRYVSDVLGLESRF